MKQTIRFVAVVWFSLILLHGVVAQSQKKQPPKQEPRQPAATQATRLRHSATAPFAPEIIKVPVTQQVSLVVVGKGVQIYECRAMKDDPALFEWIFKMPEADLFDLDGKKIGKHYAGPTWESNDGSKVLGEIKARADAKDANAIPWLLLGVKKHEGVGVFSKVTSIQRVDTTGGKPPARGCKSMSAGKEIRVQYMAIYYFYTTKP